MKKENENPTWTDKDGNEYTVGVDYALEENGGTCVYDLRSTSKKKASVCLGCIHNGSVWTADRCRHCANRWY